MSTKSVWNVDPDVWFRDGDVPGKIDERCPADIRLHSPGVWGLKNTDGFLSYSLTRLQLQLALIFILTQSVHLLLRRVYFPRGISEIVAGMILGRTFLEHLSPETFARLFPPFGDLFLESLCKLGFICFMFLVGVKMDASSVLKAGGKGLSVALAITFVPIAWALVSYYTYELRYAIYRRPTLTSFLGTNTIVPFPVVAGLLIDLKIMNSELGRIALAASLISNILTVAFTTTWTLVQLKTVGWQPMVAYQAACLSVAGGLLFLAATRQLAWWIIRQTPEGRPVKGSFVGLMAVAALISAFVSENVGLPYFVLPFVAGVVVPDGPPLGSTLAEKLDTLVLGMLTPLMMTFAVLRLDLFAFYDMGFIAVLWEIVVGATGVKLASVFVAALLCKLPVRDAAALAAVLSIQGIVEIAMYLTNFKNQTLDPDSFKTAVLSVTVLSAAVTLFVRYVYNQSSMYRGYQKRDLLHLASNSELRVLVCAHRQEDVLAAVKLLEVSGPTKASPISVYALNLVELVGRATPLLISHRVGKKAAAAGGGSSSSTFLANKSQPMIDAFQNLEGRFSGSVAFQAFTSVSLPKFMHHDVCSLAFDKLCSLVVLPFHRKWNSGGQVIYDSGTLRAINRHVLEMAPCSVAVLVDRRKIRADPSAAADRPTAYAVGVAFLGGDDDREALAYGKRMVASAAGVHLTVVRLLAAGGGGGGSGAAWDTVLDMEALKEVKLLSAHQGNVVYREEAVKDGPETALVINSMEDSFDLIMAGRRHREESAMLTGISEWSELPELGVIGDILASSDVKRPVSVLIVQQQITRGQGKNKDI